MHRSFALRLFVLTTGVLLTACPSKPVCGNNKLETGEACDDGNTTGSDGCQSDCTLTPVECGNGLRQGDEQCDDGNLENADGCDNTCHTSTIGGKCGNGAVDDSEECDDGNKAALDGCESNCKFSVISGKDAAKPAPATGACTVTAGDKTTMISGVVLTDTVIYLGGQVVVNEAGIITCVGVECEAPTATKIDCPQSIISAGLINSHDHISFQANPAMSTTERFEHRHDWRVGNDGHNKVNNGGNATNAQIRWAELRNIMAGTTSTVGATYTTNGNSGLMRNLDTSAAGQLGLNGGTVVSDTFPLGDTSGGELTMGCGYPKVPGASIVPATSAYLPHVSEGIEASANNEFTCLSAADGVGILGGRTGLVHGIGVRAADVSLIAQTGTSLIWSPRSNVSLYGDTASIPLYKRMGVNIALGTDWTISGSMNLLRELQCADSLNKTKFNRALSDQHLWRTVTANSADATATGGKIGRLAKDLVADIAIFKRRTGTGSVYRSVIDAVPQDVVLTMRGGKVLYGDAAIVAAFDPGSMCEAIDVCGTAKSACVKGELPPITTGSNTTDTLALLQSANMNTYPLFFCGTVMNEPSCVPERPMGNSKNGSSTYVAMSASDDPDGDGIATAQDNCPNVFNPIRPMDNGMQANGDGDAEGDACDVCPLDKNKTTCTVFDSNDRDADGKPNAQDNCPGTANADQADADGDAKGDLCDACPMAANPGAQACLASIYAIKAPASTLVGQRLSIANALVTGVASAGFFLQVAETDTGYVGPNFSGIYAYSPSSGVVQGDRVTIEVTTPSNFHGQVQLGGLSPVSPDGGTKVLSSANAAPAPIRIDPATIASNDGGAAYALEGVLVEVKDVAVIDIAPALGEADSAPSNEFVVTGGLRINDLMYLIAPFPAVGMQFKSIVGVLEFRNGNYKIEPRNAADFVLGPSIVLGVEPKNAFLREGSTTTIPQPLQVRLSNAEAADTVVSVVSAAPANVTITGAVTVLAGQTTALVPLTGALASATPVVVTATKDASMQTASVRVIGAADVAKLVAITPASASVSPGGTATFTVTFDLPVPAATDVTLSTTPAELGMVPVKVTVPADALSATFSMTAASATGTGTVSATAGADTVMANVKIELVSSSHLVISELAVKGPGASSASDEFVELYNPTGEAIDISGWKLQYKSATGSDATGWSLRATFPENTSLASHHFYLVASKSYVGSVTPDQLAVTSDNVATDLGLAAAAGHVRIIDAQGAVVDKVGYGTTANSSESMPVVVPAMFTNDQSMERKATAGSTPESMATGGVDATRGNGVDTDNNANDFVVRAVRDPQNAQSGVSEP